jgi:hypothetical protein
VTPVESGRTDSALIVWGIVGLSWPFLSSQLGHPRDPRAHPRDPGAHPRVPRAHPHDPRALPRVWRAQRTSGRRPSRSGDAHPGIQWGWPIIRREDFRADRDADQVVSRLPKRVILVGSRGSCRAASAPGTFHPQAYGYVFDNSGARAARQEPRPPISNCETRPGPERFPCWSSGRRDKHDAFRNGSRAGVSCLCEDHPYSARESRSPVAAVRPAAG